MKDETNAQRALQELLRSGLTVVTKPFSCYKARDWATCVYAEDIDDDGDIEILYGSRDGYIHALTKQGNKKWEMDLGSWVTTVISIPRAEQNVRVIAGTREGMVYGLNRKGDVQWSYAAHQVIRQVYVHPERPDRVVVGSEDYCVYVLDSETKEVQWQYKTNEWVVSVLVHDIDADGQLEVLVASADKHIYVFPIDGQGEPKAIIETEHKIYALQATRPVQDGPTKLLTSSNNKDLAVWSVLTPENQPLTLQLEWSKEQYFDNRIHAICIEDINGDNQVEILAGSEDRHLYIFDMQGKVLWKYNVGHAIYSVYARDIDENGIVEILIGLEDNTIQVLHIELIKDLYANIMNNYSRLNRSEKQAEQIRQVLSVKEYDLLRDLLPYERANTFEALELDVADLAVKRRQYEKALPILLRLRKQKVQYYWFEPNNELGHIRAACLGDIAKDSIDEMLIGNDEGEVVAVDIRSERGQILWRRQFEARVRMLQMGTPHQGYYDKILACLANRRLCIMNHRGEVLERGRPILDENDYVLGAYVNKRGTHPDYEVIEIILGLENNKVYVYDGQLRNRLLTIELPYGIKEVYTYDLRHSGNAEIICGTIDNHVYVYTREGEKLWGYEVKDRVQALYVEDIDNDGEGEIIIGSEDRNVYVLDAEGHLKWRYYLPHRALDIAVADIDHDGCKEVFVGCADGYMYTLDKDGDLLWKFEANDRVRVVLARDMNNDGKVEIAVGSDDRLVLLQVVDQHKLEELLDLCWQHLVGYDNYTHEEALSALKQTLLRLIEDPDGNIRAFAFLRLAGLIEYRYTKNDIELVQKALGDKHLAVRRELPHIVINLCLSNQQDPENVARTRHWLQRLFTDPDQEVRLAIVNMLPLLVEESRDPALTVLCFEMLERFMTNVDVWVRRTVVRKLYKLVETHPEQAYTLLLELAKDDDEWIGQEVGRSLAHYFDIYTNKLVMHIHEILQKGAQRSVIQHIYENAISGQQTIVQRLLKALLLLLTPMQEEQVLSILDQTIDTLQEASRQGLERVEGVSQVYQEFRQLFRTNMVDDIEQYQSPTGLEMAKKDQRYTGVIQVFYRINDFIDVLKIYRIRETLEDKFRSLHDSVLKLDEIRREVDKTLINPPPPALARELPEKYLFPLLFQRWEKILAREFHRIKGEADLRVELGQEHFQHEEQVVIPLLISNHGSCAADNVHVRLCEDKRLYEIVGEKEKFLKEISTNHDARLEFTIKPRVSAPHLDFGISYDDAEGKGKTLRFADDVKLQTEERPFTRIINPYNSGLPVQDNDSEMFFGRKESLEYLRSMLSSTTTNRVVVLMGQRRAGKSSLMYQLVRDMRQYNDAYQPVLITFNSLGTAEGADKLLYEIARHIAETLRDRSYAIALPTLEAFTAQYTQTFEAFLKQTLQTVPGGRLVLLIDEFEQLDQMVQGGQIQASFLQYLRGIMHDLPGINYLLAGTPRIKKMTKDYWSTFFNIALYHEISKLDAESATQLITVPVKELQYDDLAVEKIRQLTGDWPYLIHLLCGNLIRHCNKLHKTYVTINDVNMTVDTVFDSGEDYFSWIWGISSPTEQFLLSILAQGKGGEDRVFSLADIKQEYYQQGQETVYDRNNVLAALRDLEEKEIVEARQNETQFRVPVGLIKAWLRKTWPPERVLRAQMQHPAS
jgi:outer membrane protein assembly factor BamB